MNNNIQHIDPDGLLKNPAFSQGVVTRGNGKTIYIGGQNSVNANRETIGKNNLQVRTEQVMQNIQTALSACGARFENLVKLFICIVEGQNPTGAFQAAQNPPAVSVMVIAGLSNPDFLIEIDAIAFVPE